MALETTTAKLSVVNARFDYRVERSPLGMHPTAKGDHQRRLRHY
jgi:hypothetical protein